MTNKDDNNKESKGFRKTMKEGLGQGLDKVQKIGKTVK